MTLSGFEFVVVVLAASRATTAVTHDSVLDRPRNAYLSWCRRHAPKLKELATCPHCAGFHLSWISYLVAVLVLGRFEDAPIVWHLVMCWAVAGGQVLANGILGGTEAVQEEDD